MLAIFKFFFENSIYTGHDRGQGEGQPSEKQPPPPTWAKGRQTKNPLTLWKGRRGVKVSAHVREASEARVKGNFGRPKEGLRRPQPPKLELKIRPKEASATKPRAEKKHTHRKHKT